MSTNTCDLNNPFLDIIDNPTRRKLLHLISCEPNYGNRLSSILNISPTAVHRHLKSLQGDISNIGPIITETDDISGVISGKTSGNLFKINQKLGLFYNIFPNFIHSQVFQIDKDGTVSSFSTLPPLSKNPRYILNTNSTSSKIIDVKKISNISGQVEKINARINSIEKELMELFDQKNDLLQILNNDLVNAKDLKFNERMILRGMVNFTGLSVRTASRLLNLDKYLVVKYFDSLIEKGLVTTNKLSPILEN
ncbi:MAG: ArsR family transcriptional regulator [Candidatus Heimdallarchaeota archaeon]|nr:ArsR family transcriptional regulator [Candidatus Heimdallarchaeota archaeon]